MHRLVYGLSRAMAWFGAFVLTAIALMSVASIVGRALAAQGLGPVPGDFELVFGCVMDSLSMILLTVPIFFPMVSGLDFGLPAEEVAIWFGILVLIVVEVGLITPPVGMNLFVIKSMAPHISIRETYRGVWPFIAADLLRVVLIVVFPAITLFVLRL